MKNPSIEIIAEVEAPKPPITEDRMRRYFRESSDATAKYDRLRREEAGYYHNKQIPDEVKAKWNQRGQPLVWTNKVQPAISGILGIYDAAQTDPQCQPRSPAQQNSADLATKILRYLNDCADIRTKKATISKDFFVYGTCAAIVGEGAYDGCSDIDVRAIRWQEFFYDPASREHDFSDATYMGICKWLDAQEVRKLFPERYEALGNPFDSNSSGWHNSKGDEHDMWLDHERRRIRVIELYYRDDDLEWQRVTFCEAGYLSFAPSPYRDDKGRSLCPILAASYEVDPETRERYGPIATMRPLQDEFNARRAVLLNESQNHRIRQVEENVDPKSKAIAQAEAPKANGVIPFGWDMVSVPDIAQGQAALLQQTQADLDRLAPTPAILGRMQGQDSGRARQILQQAGYTEWARAFWYLEKLEERINRHLWFAAKQFMTAPQWIRATGEAEAAEFHEVNVPVGVKHVPKIDPATKQPMVDPATGMPMFDTQPVLEKSIAQMDVDIILDTVPDTVTIQQEVNAQILQYAEGLGIRPTTYEFRAVLEMFLTVDKTRQLEKWDAMFAKSQEQNAAQMQMQQQMMQMQQQLEATKIQTKAAKDSAQAHKAEAEANRTEFETTTTARAHLVAEQDQQRLRQTFQSLGPLPPPGFAN